MVQPASLDVVYPGIWLDDGVYATHGHYLDRHVTVPSFERLGSGVLGRAAAARRPTAPPRPTTTRSRSPRCTRCSTRSPRASATGAPRRRARSRRAPGSACRPTASATPGAAACSPAPSRWPSRRSTGSGIGPLQADLSGAELRRASLRAMGEVVARLRHRRAPRDLRPHPPLGPAARRRRRRVAAGRRRAADATPAAGSTSRCTSTATGAARTGRARRSSSTSGGEPRFVRLLEGIDADALRPPAAPLPA